MALPGIEFEEIRGYRGSKRTGFEELAVQLIPWIADVDVREVIRHEAPDGGIEARVEFGDGSIWGWQAKYFFGFGDSRIAQMKDPFETALQRWPSLTRYTFVFPSDPSTGRQGQARKSEAEKINDAFVRWKSTGAEQGRDLEIDYVGGSRIRDVLLAEEHAGRVRYWFDQRPLFSSDWLRQKLALAIAAAEPRYTPEVNVELPIADVFEGLGRTPAFDKRLGDVVASVQHAAKFLHPLNEDPVPRRLRSDIEQARRQVDSLVEDLGGTSVQGTACLDWQATVGRIEEVRRCLVVVDRRLSVQIRRLRTREGGSGPLAPWRLLDQTRQAVIGTHQALYRLNGFLLSPDPPKESA